MEQTSGWKGFAGVMLVIVGILNIFNGLVAITQSNYISRATGGVLPLTNNVKTWGWGAVIIGVIVLLAGLGVFSGATWARVVGVFVAGVNLIYQFGFLGGNAFWSFTMMVIDILVIYALVVHGGREYDTA